MSLSEKKEAKERIEIESLDKNHTAEDKERVNRKIEAFEYILYQLREWYQSAFHNPDSNDISVLKAMKLLFFVANIDKASDSNESPSDLLDIFDEFQAWQYGHVEADVYNNLKISNNICLDRNGLTINENGEKNIQKWARRNNNLVKRIDNSIEALKKENFNLIKEKAFDLVNISHSYFSWNYYYIYSDNLGETIPLAVLRNERKHYK